MADGRSDPTLRPPPRVDGASGAVVDALHAEPPRLDDLARARMERSLLETWSMRPAARVAFPVAVRTPSRMAWAGSLAAAALVGIGFGLHAMDRARPLASGTAGFELRVGEAAVQSGTVTEGQLLESGPHGRIEVSLGPSLVDMAPGTRVRFDRISDDELRLGLVAGRVDVDFHPSRRGEQTLAVETRVARVLVVGTRFRVEVDTRGNTTVAVSEGVVEVVPRRGGATRRVRAGEEAQVGIDDADAPEHAVRASIEGDIAKLDEAAPSVPSALDGASAEVTADMDFGDEPAALAGALADATREEQVTVVRQLEAANKLLRQGRHELARDQLRHVIEGPHAARFRVEALTLIAESHTVQGQIPKAREAYERASRIAPSQPAGHNAIFALARLLERHTSDRASAVDAYERYLERAPRGALASQARDALCRLGEASHCR